MSICLRICRLGPHEVDGRHVGDVPSNATNHDSDTAGGLNGMAVMERQARKFYWWRRSLVFYSLEVTGNT